MRLGGRLKQAREKRKMTQEDLAAAVRGASQAMISALEKRDSKRTHLLFAFAEALEVNPEWLATGVGDSWLDHPPRTDPLLRQLVEIYSQLTPDGRDTLLGNANRLLATEKPGGPHDPFPKALKRPQARSVAKKVPTV